MSNNIINLNSVRNKNTLDELVVKEIGTINITVFLEETTNSPVYYLLPDKKELTPIVDLSDDTLAHNSFRLSQELKIRKI